MRYEQNIAFNSTNCLPDVVLALTQSATIKVSPNIPVFPCQ